MPTTNLYLITLFLSSDSLITACCLHDPFQTRSLTQETPLTSSLLHHQPSSPSSWPLTMLQVCISFIIMFRLVLFTLPGNPFLSCPSTWCFPSVHQESMLHSCLHLSQTSWSHPLYDSFSLQMYTCQSFYRTALHEAKGHVLEFCIWSLFLTQN